MNDFIAFSVARAQGSGVPGRLPMTAPTTPRLRGTGVPTPLLPMYGAESVVNAAPGLRIWWRPV